jgi:hypothetical protein
LVDQKSGVQKTTSLPVPVPPPVPDNNEFLVRMNLKLSWPTPVPPLRDEDLKKNEEWTSTMEQKYDEEQRRLIHDYMFQIQNGNSIPAPTKKYALIAAEGFKIMIQSFKNVDCAS